MKLLLVEDNNNLAEIIREWFEKKGYHTDISNNAEEAIDLYISESYDCIILDIILPGMSGIQMCDFIRKEEKSKIPIIMLTAMDKVEEKINGLECGADDYLTKPFDFRELEARIKSITKRNEADLSEILEFKGLKLDIERRSCFFFTSEIRLTKKEFDLLELFMRSPGKIFSREMIQDILWDSEKTGKSNIVDVYVLYLRRKLKVFMIEKYIETVPLLGYRFRNEAR